MPAPKQPARSNVSRPSRAEGRNRILILEEGDEARPVIPRPSDNWRPEVARWWLNIPNLPQFQFMAQSDIMALHRLASMQHDFLEIRDAGRRARNIKDKLAAARAQATLSRAILTLEKEFGFTMMSRAQGGWELESQEPNLLDNRANQLDLRRRNLKRPPPVVPWEDLGVSDKWERPEDPPPTQ